MITRILALFALLFVASGGAWYLLRDTPQKRVVRWREEAKFFLEKTADLEKAEELTNRVLELLPNSAYDLVFKASVKERRGSVQSLKEALEVYDKVLSGGDPNVSGVAILKARVCRSLGLISEAQGTLLSVVDLFPFEAMLELGEACIAGLAAGEAYQYFLKAKDSASSPLEVARAQEGLANALMLLLSTSTGNVQRDVKFTARAPEDLAKLKEALTRGARKALNEALNFFKSDDAPSSAEDANRRLVWATLLVEKLAQLKDEGASPFSDGLLLIEGRRGDYGIRGKETAALLVRLGALRLWVLRDEPPRDSGAAAPLEKESEENFMQALGKTPGEARALLAQLLEEAEDLSAEKSQYPPESGGKAAISEGVVQIQGYLQTLVSVSRVCLGTAQFQRLIKDESALSLAERITDAIESGPPGVARQLTLLRGFAKLKASSGSVEGEKDLEKYLAGLPADLRSRGVVDVAEQSLAIMPGESLCLKQLDKFEAQGGGVLDHVGRRVALLLAAGARAQLASEASNRLEKVLKDITEAAQSVVDLVGVSKILYSLKGNTTAASVIQLAVNRYPQDTSVARLHADLQYEIAVAPGTQSAAKDAAYREALSAYLFLFVKAPGDSQEIVRRLVEIIRGTEESGADLGFERALRRFFPSVPERALETFTVALRMFLLGQFGPANDRISSIAAKDLEQLRPFSSFLKGSCHVGLATYLLRDLGRATLDTARQGLLNQHKAHVQSAMEEFRREPDSMACQFELSNLEFQTVPPNEDISEVLLKRIQALSDAGGQEHSAHFLYARALRHRFKVRYRQEKVKNSELARVLGREQRVLRAAIRKSPRFLPAYLALAETWVVSDQSEGAGKEIMSRNLFTPNLGRAVSILRAVPGPDEAVLNRLAQLHEAMGRVDLSILQLEQLALKKPSADVFSRLLAGYLKSRSPAARFFLDEEVPTEATPSADADALKERLPTLLSLRSSFETLPEHEGLRRMFRAMEAERLMTQATSEFPRKKARELMLDEYFKALEAYDSKSLKVPLVVINNLAWHLAEDPDPDRKARALQIGERIKKMVPNPTLAPDAYDTYAWVLYKSDQLSEAERVLRELLKVADQPTYRYHLARVFFAQKKFDEALKEAQAARDSPREFAESDAARDLEYEIREARRKAIGE